MSLWNVLGKAKSRGKKEERRKKEEEKSKGIFLAKGERKC